VRHDSSGIHPKLEIVNRKEHGPPNATSRRPGLLRPPRHRPTATAIGCQDPAARRTPQAPPGPQFKPRVLHHFLTMTFRLSKRDSGRRSSFTENTRLIQPPVPGGQGPLIIALTHPTPVAESANLHYVNIRQNFAACSPGSDLIKTHKTMKM
jgi:hypothetical protein